MFVPTLNFNQGLAEIGTPTHTGEFIINEQTPIKKQYQEFLRELPKKLQKIHNLEAIRNMAIATDPYASDILSQYIGETYNEINSPKQKFAEFTKSLLEGTTVNSRDLFRAVREAIFNAIEHQESPITINIFGNETSTLVTIKQDTVGPTEEQIREIADSEKIEIISPSNQIIRGRGLKLLSSENTPPVWFEFAGEKSPFFTVIILETRRRLEELEKQYTQLL